MANGDVGTFGKCEVNGRGYHAKSSIDNRGCTGNSQTRSRTGMNSSV